jgi:hypothetical protein
MNCLLTVKSILSYQQQPISAIDVEKYATFGTKRQENGACGVADPNAFMNRLSRLLPMMNRWWF